MAFQHYHQEIPEKHKDPLLQFLHRVIRFGLKVLAVLMVLVILWGILDVVYELVHRISTPPLFLLNINDIFSTFGAFMAVLIAIEIFINIRIYLGAHELPIKLVVGTALMAISRKVILLDVDKLAPMDIFSISFGILALGVSYWLVGHNKSLHSVDTKSEDA